MKFNRTKREELAINMTPLIDVVFLLLIFFMVTTTFSRETRLLVSYSINGRALVNSRLETLMQGLEIESGGDRSLPILLIADAESTHQAVVTAMDGIGQSGFTRLNIATQRPQELEQAGAAPTDQL